MMETCGFEKARLVGVYNQKKCFSLAPLQLPLYIDDTLMMVIQFEDLITKRLSCSECSFSDFDEFMVKHQSLDKEELKEACSVDDRDLFMCISTLVPCVGCRRSVELLFQQVQKLDNSAFESLTITPGCVTISAPYMNNSKKLYHLLYSVRPKLFELLKSLMSSKRNKRCVFHSLKIQKASELPCDNKLNLPKWCDCSVLDVWDRMCSECQKEVSTLDMDGVKVTMDHYLKKHRFCCECKSNVMKAFNILTQETDSKGEPGYCSAIYEGLHSCKSETDDKEKSSNEALKSSSHIHMCCERSFIVHCLTQADAEIIGGKRERHAKTIDIAQEEVCTCLALYLYQRLHKVWHQKLIFEQTWLTLLYLGLEAIRQNFETYFELKVGFGRMEALCKELEQADRDKEIKLRKKRLRKKRQQKKKKEQKGDPPEEEIESCEVHQNVTGCHTDQCRIKNNFNHLDSENLHGEFHPCLLDLLTNEGKCECLLNGESDDDSINELTEEEILEFEKNRSEINAQRTRLRERIRQDFENFCSVAITSASNG